MIVEFEIVRVPIVAVDPSAIYTAFGEVTINPSRVSELSDTVLGTLIAASLVYTNSKFESVISSPALIVILPSILEPGTPVMVRDLSIVTLSV